MHVTYQMVLPMSSLTGMSGAMALALCLPRLRAGAASSPLAWTSRLQHGVAMSSLPF